MQTCSIYSMYIESYRDEVFMELANLDVSFSELDDVMKVCIVCVCVCGCGCRCGCACGREKGIRAEGGWSVSLRSAPQISLHLISAVIIDM